MLTFIKENKTSKEWKTVKILIDFENGMQLALKPENVSLIDNGGKNSIAIARTAQTIIPLVFFDALLATPEEIKARGEKAPAPPAEVPPPTAPPPAEVPPLTPQAGL